MMSYKPCLPENLLVLILDAEQTPYSEIKMKGSYPTWVSDLRKSGIEYYYYYGNSKVNYKQGDTIKLECPDNAFTEKFVKSLNILFHKNYPTKFLLRTNSSSYWRVSYLRRIISFVLDKNIDYFGVGGFDYITKCNFASGSGFIISPKITKLIFEHSDQINCSLIDDVAIGHFLFSKNIQITNGFRLNLQNRNWRIKALFPGIFHYHFRCKTRSLNTLNRLTDIKKMNFLHHFYAS